MTWPQDAYVGQKVVCVRVGDYLVQYSTMLHIDDVYTIAEIICEDQLYFRIKEVNEEGEYLKASRFRPLQENKKGMEMLTALLNPINHKVLEDV